MAVQANLHQEAAQQWAPKCYTLDEANSDIFKSDTRQTTDNKDEGQMLLSFCSNPVKGQMNSE